MGIHYCSKRKDAYYIKNPPRSSRTGTHVSQKPSNTTITDFGFGKHFHAWNFIFSESKHISEFNSQTSRFQILTSHNFVLSELKPGVHELTCIIIKTF